MSISPNYNQLLTLLDDGVTVNHIAEPLNTIDIRTPKGHTIGIMEQNNYDLIGVTKEEKVIGYIEYDKSDNSVLGPIMNFQSIDLISANTPLSLALTIISVQKRIFILDKNNVASIATIADLEKPPVRMMIFSILNLLETELTYLIHTHVYEADYSKYINDINYAMAKERYNEKQLKNQEISFVWYFTFTDKINIIKRNENLLAILNFSSKTQYTKMTSSLIDLRNEIAHARPFSFDWNKIGNYINNMRDLIKICEGNKK
ncbi:hypothetical protein [Alkalicoccus luteus]|uniref:hypothetical protein n=1 Tax=Alkalicoccus luteus TaxID=1237094 RepID=UPI004034EA2F